MAGTAALGLFRELRTQPTRSRLRTSRRGQVEHRPVATSPASARPPRLAHSKRATSCRKGSNTRPPGNPRTPQTGAGASNPAAPPAPPDPASSPCRSRGPGPARRHQRHHHRPAAPAATSPTTARTAIAAGQPDQPGASPARHPAPHHAREPPPAPPAAPRSPPAAARSPAAPQPAHSRTAPQHPPHPGQRQPQPPRSTANTLSTRKSRTTRQRVAAREPVDAPQPRHRTSEYLRLNPSTSIATRNLSARVPKSCACLVLPPGRPNPNLVMMSHRPRWTLSRQYTGNDRS